MCAGSHFCASTDRGGSVLSDLIIRMVTVLAVVSTMVIWLFL
jgi:hypothetical protein